MRSPKGIPLLTFKISQAIFLVQFELSTFQGALVTTKVKGFIMSSPTHTDTLVLIFLIS